MLPNALRLRLSFPPDPARIEPIRQTVSLSASVVFGDVPLHDSLAMACAELVENGVKYGSAAASTMSLEIEDDGREIVLVVTSTVDARSGHADALRARIAWLESYPDARSAYLAALTRVYEGGDLASSESGLGIVRVAYEGGARVDCDTQTTGLVTVRARFPHPRSDA